MKTIRGLIFTKKSLKVILIRFSILFLVFIIFVFIAQYFVDGFTEFFFFNPNSPNLWMFVTSIFLHAGFVHLVYNLYALAMFAPFLEKAVGEKNFLLVFLFAGIAGNLLYYVTIIFGIAQPIAALGASGAIYGIMGALSVLTPRLVVLFYGVPFPIRPATALWAIIGILGSLNPQSQIGNALCIADPDF